MGARRRACGCAHPRMLSLRNRLWRAILSRDRSPAYSSSSRRMPSNASIASLLAQLEGVKVALIQRYFAYDQLAEEFNYTARAPLMARLQRMLEGGTLQPEQLRAIVIDLGESGDKKTYLVRVDPALLRNLRASSFPSSVPSPSAAPLVTSAAQPRLVYSCVTDTHVRFAFVETHLSFEKDLAARRLRQVDVLRRIIFSVDRATGEGFLAFDPPREVTPHESHLEYFLHYRAKVEEMIGGSLQEMALHAALHNLDQHRLTTMKSLSSRSNDMTHFTVSSELEVRETAVFTKVAGEMAQRSAARLYWLSGLPCNTPRGIIALQRNVRTDIDADAGLVRFASQTISAEVEYVLAQLRAHS